MFRFIHLFIVGVIVDFFLFPVAPAPFPELNSKKVMAVIGLPLLVLHILRTRKYTIASEWVFNFFIAAAYSVVNIIAVDYNETYDYSYANYITTFLTWTMAAYTTIWALRTAHKEISFKLITSYFATICAIQCVLAILIDRIEVLKIILNEIFYLTPEMFEEINRLYAIGVGLDAAGMRFAVVAVMIAFVLCTDEKIKQNNKAIFGYLLSFMIIAILGNMISRTTSIGILLGLVTFVVSTGIYRLVIVPKNIKIFSMLGTLILIGVPLLVFLYNTDEFTHDQLRFAFEGFFNWVEKGEWKTASTEKLSNTMWVWPEDTKTWIIGSGLYGGFLYDTDIGYCRLILYSGVIGFATFSLLFVYNAFSFMQKYPRYQYMFLMMLSLTFIFWVKTSTDIYQFYALFLCFMDKKEASPQYLARIES